MEHLLSEHVNCKIFDQEKRFDNMYSGSMIWMQLMQLARPNIHMFIIHQRHNSYADAVSPSLSLLCHVRVIHQRHITNTCLISILLCICRPISNTNSRDLFPSIRQILWREKTRVPQLWHRYCNEYAMFSYLFILFMVTISQ